MWIDMEVLGLHPEWAVFREVEGPHIGKRMSLVCTLKGQCSGTCGEASYRGKCLTLAGRNGGFENK